MSVPKLHVQILINVYIRNKEKNKYSKTKSDILILLFYKHKSGNKPLLFLRHK